MPLGAAINVAGSMVEGRQGTDGNICASRYGKGIEG